MPIDIHTLSVIAFIIIAALILFRDRKKVKRESIVFFRRTDRGKAFLTHLGSGHPAFWKAVGNIAVATGFLGSFFILFVLTLLAVTGIFRPVATSGLAIVLPTPGTDALVGTGYIGVPFWFWIISISILMVVHEGLHGVMAAREGIRIKSLGLVLLAVIPGAFVEPDEKQMKKKPLMSRLRVFASGSFANFSVGAVAGALILLLTGILAVPFLGNFSDHTGGLLYDASPSGIGYGLIQDYPAEEANFTGAIIQVNGVAVSSREEMADALGTVRPGDSASFLSSTGGERTGFTLTAAPDPKNASRGIFGFSSLFTLYSYNLRDQYQTAAPAVSVLVGAYPFGFGGLETLNTAGLIFWIFLINTGVGLFNLLPIRGLDGGLMWHAVLERFARVRAKIFMNALTAFILIVIFANFAAGFGLFRAFA